MNKKLVSKQGAISEDEEESYEVDKIVNHRIVGDRKEYKVIWAGYSFEEATWQPEENLKCPEKIAEFLKRYQEVVHKKKMIKPKSQLINNSQTLSLISSSKSKAVEPPKLSIERNGPIQQQKIQTNPASVLNREKLQASMEKNNLIPPKKSTDIDNLKQKIMNPFSTSNVKIHPDHPSTQTRQIINTADLFSPPRIISPNSNGIKLNLSKDQVQRSSDFLNGSEQTRQKIKVQSHSSKIQNPDRSLTMKIEDRNQENFKKISQKLKINQIDVDRRQDRNSQFEFLNRINSEERKISHFEEEDTRQVLQDSSENYTDSPIFMKASERMDIETICGIPEFGSQFEKDEKREGKRMTKNPQFLVVKNKYSEKEKLVEKQRVIVQQPMKLIEFYESLLTDSMR